MVKNDNMNAGNTNVGEVKESFRTTLLTAYEAINEVVDQAKSNPEVPQGLRKEIDDLAHNFERHYNATKIAFENWGPGKTGSPR